MRSGGESGESARAARGSTARAAARAKIFRFTYLRQMVDCAHSPGDLRRNVSSRNTRSAFPRDQSDGDANQSQRSDRVSPGDPALLVAFRLVARASLRRLLLVVVEEGDAALDRAAAHPGHGAVPGFFES